MNLNVVFRPVCTACSRRECCACIPPRLLYQSCKLGTVVLCCSAFKPAAEVVTTLNRRLYTKGERRIFFTAILRDLCIKGACVSPPGDLWRDRARGSEGAGRTQGVAGESGPWCSAQGGVGDQGEREDPGERGQGEGARPRGSGAEREPGGGLWSDAQRQGEASVCPGGGLPSAGDRRGRAGQGLGHQAPHQGRPGARQQEGEWGPRICHRPQRPHGNIIDTHAAVANNRRWTFKRLADTWPPFEHQNKRHRNKSTHWRSQHTHTVVNCIKASMDMKRKHIQTPKNKMYEKMYLCLMSNWHISTLFFPFLFSCSFLSLMHSTASYFNQMLCSFFCCSFS